MWDLIVSVPDHCLSFYFTTFTVPIISLWKVAIVTKAQKQQQ